MGDSSGGGVSDLEVESAGAGGSNIATGRSGEAGGQLNRMNIYF